MKKLISVIFSLTLPLCALCGCGDVQTDPDAVAETGSSAAEASAVDAANLSEIAANMFSDRDRETDFSEGESVTITFDGSSAVSSSDSVKISGSSVTISQEATYILSGRLDNGTVTVDAGDTDKIQIVLNDADITSETSAALYILKADKVFLTLAPNSENSLSNGGSFVAIDENDIDAALFSKQDLTINGTGSLKVTSPNGHGITCKDDLVITGGTYAVSAAFHGFDANDSVRIADGRISIVAGKDGIHAENSDDASLGFVYVSGGTLSIDAEGDGVSSGAYTHIESGSFDIISGGGSENAAQHNSGAQNDFMGRAPQDPFAASSSAASTDDGTSSKGLKASGNLLISNGSFRLNTADDAVHSNNSVTVSGGSFDIATGDDAFHADDTLTISDGTILVSESYEGLEALHIAVSGGEITVYASDDGLNAAGGTDSSGFGGTFGGGDAFGRPGMGGGMSSSSNGGIVISGGTIYVNASGDGIDANGSLSITGGYTTVCGPTQGDTATLDYDTSATISGGTFIGTGASGMAQTFSDSEQGIIAVRVGTQAAGTTIILQDKKGNTVIEYTPELSFGVVILSTPDMVTGEIYTITVGSVSEEFEAS